MNDHVFTPSELEDYLLCPFRFYARSVLKLEERPVREPELTPREIGIVMHRILEEFLGGRDLSLEVLQKRASSILDRFQTGRPGLSVPLFRRQKENIERTLVSFFKMEVETLPQEKGLRPAFFEWSFGDPPLTISNGDGEPIWIRGRIDRIDVDHEKRQFLVIDYKTGAKKKSLAVPIYLLAVERLLLPGYRPAGGILFYLSDMTKEDVLCEGLFQRTIEAVREIATEIGKGVFPSRKEPCEPFCPFKDICLLRNASSRAWHRLCQ